MHRTGLEPVTTRFEAGYSIRLSYRCGQQAMFLPKNIFLRKVNVSVEKSEGIVLRSIDYQDKQKIITLFTPEAGLMSLFMRRISPRNLALLSLATPFSQAEFHYTKGRSDLYGFRDGTLIEGNLHLRGSLSHLQTAGELVQTILLSQLPGKPAPALYALLTTYIKHIPQFEDPSPLIASFYLKVLHHEGLLCLETETLPEIDLLKELLHSKSFHLLKSLPLPKDTLHRTKKHFLSKIKQ